MQARERPLVSTIKERCRVCYTCVRECPAKAIRIVDQQAEVVGERCIACGNCVRVCSQHAKKVASDLDYVYALLRSEAQVAAIVAPSFPAEFSELGWELFVGMLRALGFDYVNEVSFGADLVAAEYRHLLERSPDQRFIATSCPAIVGFVERYHPDLVPALAPIVSPMIATARALRRQHGEKLRIVFIGPCIAKKGEASSDPVLGDVNAAMTFAELRELFALTGVQAGDATPSDFDPPHGGFGGLFPISRGMLQAADIDEDLVSGEVVAADGRSEFVDAIREFESGDLNVQLLECLCCNGCIMGPGYGVNTPLFRRRAQVSRFVRERMARLDRRQWKRDVAEYTQVDLTRGYLPNDQRVAAPSEADVQRILERMGKHGAGDELNCGACGYETCRDHAIAIYKGLAESEMCLPFMIEELKKTCGELTLSNEQLASAQEALMQSEKLASMGQLAAGIAHEVNNPLGTVLMLAHILLEELPPDDPRREDLELVVGEADRCKKIVSGLLHFARKNKVEAQRVDVAELVQAVADKLRKVSGKVTVAVDRQAGDTEAEIDRDQILQVLTNLTSNALAAMPGGGKLTLRCGGKDDEVWLAVADTGTGIPEEIRKKIFEPFFTTKKAGEGTGLGLAVTYGVVKMHHGDVRLKSNADAGQGPTGTTFTITLPRKRRTPAPPATDPSAVMMGE
jgi:two-component system NtrC family sensor kinase